MIPGYCINLDERTDRWQLVQKQFNKHGFKIKRFSAVKKAPGWMGCTQSHIDLLMILRSERYFFIFEDDVVLLPNFADTLIKAISELPENWDLLYLGANLQQPITKYSKHLCRLKGAFCTHAMLFNNNRGLADYIIGHSPTIKKIDIFYRDHLQEHFNTFICNPMIATQADSYSDITRKNQKYEQLMIDNFNKNILP